MYVLFYTSNIEALLQNVDVERPLSQLRLVDTQTLPYINVSVLFVTLVPLQLKLMPCFTVGYTITFGIFFVTCPDKMKINGLHDNNKFRDIIIGKNNVNTCA